jgi:hypothetical protein
MKRLKFKKPFNGMDNAKKLIPESYKVDGNEFEMTDGNETYRVKWSSLINEGIVLTSSNKGQINEDMGKMKHLMGFKSQETLGTVKGADRLDENKKFGDVLDKTKKLINESEETMGGPIPSEPYQANENSNNKLISQVKNKFGLDDLIFSITVDKPEHEYRGGNGSLYVYAEKGEDSVEFRFNAEANLDYEGAPEDLHIEKEKTKYPNDYSEYVKFITQFITPEAYKELEENIDIEFDGLNEGEHIKSGMGGSNKGKSRTDKTEVLKKDSKKQRRKADKEATKDINENDVANFQDALGSNPKVVNAAKKLNTPIEKIEAAVKFINNIAGDDDALIGKIIRAIKKDDSDVVNELENSELADLNKDGELSSYEEKRGSAIEKAMEAPVDETYEDDYYDFDDTTTSIEGEPGYNQSDINPIDTDLLSQIDPTNTKAGREAKKYGQDDVRKDTSQPKKGIHPLDPRKHALPYDLDSYGPDDLPTPPSEEEEQAAQVYEDRFDEVFEGMYEEEDLNENVGDE